MRTNLTITSKGQTTLPVALRRKLGLAETGGELHLDFDERTGKAVITKPLSLEQLSEQISTYIAPGTKPVTDAGGYYQKYRGVHR